MKQMLTYKEVASMLGVSFPSVWKWTRNGRLPSPVRIGRTTRWRLADIQAVIDGAWKANDAA